MLSSCNASGSSAVVWVAKGRRLPDLLLLETEKADKLPESYAPNDLFMIITSNLNSVSPWLVGRSFLGLERYETLRPPTPGVLMACRGVRGEAGEARRCRLEREDKGGWREEICTRWNYWPFRISSDFPIIRGAICCWGQMRTEGRTAKTNYVQGCL